MGVIRLTPGGLELLEERILMAYAENPAEIRQAFDVLSMDLDEFLRKNVPEYEQVIETAVRTLGVEPDYLLSMHVRRLIGDEEERKWGRRYSFT